MTSKDIIIYGLREMQIACKESSCQGCAIHDICKEIFNESVSTPIDWDLQVIQED